MLVRQIADGPLAQYAYLIGCQQTGEAIVIDPERDIDRYVAAAAAEGLRIVAVAETHIHADFLSGARQFAFDYPGTHVYLSDEGGPEWTYQWPQRDGVRVTYLRDGDTLAVGRIEIRAWHTPGHTPEHLSYFVTDRGAGADVPMALVSGDFVFVGDLGRPDLLETAAGIRGTIEPSARQLFASARRFLDLPDYIQIWPGHGAGSACGKALGAVPSTTVGYERCTSPALAAVHAGERAFIDFILDGQPEPPGYFARMKQLNRLGPPLVGSRPPRRLRADDLQHGYEGVQVVDTRTDRQAFFHAHLVGSFHAPLDRSFVTIAGSMLDPERPIVLVAEPHQLESARLQLLRIGFDRLDGWTSPGVLQDGRLSDRVGRTVSIGFPALQRAIGRGASVLDVRSGAEYASGHIPGAVNMAHTRLRPELDRLPRHGPLYVHCASGARAAAAVAFLEHHGLQAIHVDGSFTEWMSHGEPVAAMSGAA